MERGRLGSKCCSPLRGLSTVPSLEASSQVLLKTNDSLPGCPAPPRLAPPGSSRLQLHRGLLLPRAMPTHWLPSCRAPPVAPGLPHTCACGRVCAVLGARPGAHVRVWLCQAVCLSVHTYDRARSAHSAEEDLLPSSSRIIVLTR